MMFQQARETQVMESTSLLVSAFRWRKPLVIVTCLAALGAFIFTGPAFIAPKFRSTVIFFPTSTNSISKALLEDNPSERQDILAFGAEAEAEQMIQILNSDAIRESVIRQFDLMNHYRISPTSNQPYTALTEKYKDNISFARTEFMSVRIDVLDENPQTAADIANSIASLMDSTKRAIQGQRAQEAQAIIQQTYDEKLEAIRIKEDSLAEIRRLGVVDYTNQSKIWSEEYARSLAAYNNEKASLDMLLTYQGQDSRDTAVIHTRARIEGARARMKVFQVKLDLLAELGGASLSLSEQLELDRTEAARLNDQLKKLTVDARQQLSTKFIVNKANPSESKATPVRWLLVMLTTAGAFLFTFALLLFSQRLRTDYP